MTFLHDYEMKETLLALLMYIFISKRERNRGEKKLIKSNQIFIYSIKITN